MRKLLICGLGNSALRLLEEYVRARRPDIAITVVSGESPVGYDRIRLAQHLRGVDEDSLFIHKSHWFEEHGISLVAEDPVTEICWSERRVTTLSGRILNYDDLVLALGSRPQDPIIPGLPRSAVRTFRTLADARALRRELKPGMEVAVLGGGVLGVELADALVDGGAQVHLICRAPRLLCGNSTLLSSAVVQYLVRKNVNIHFGRSVGQGCGGDGRERIQLTLDDGSCLFVQQLIAAVGVRPNDDVPRKSGIRCAETGGVLVDEFLETSAEGVWGLGELVQWQGQNFGNIDPCYAMAKVLAARLFYGDKTAFAPPMRRLVVKLSGGYAREGGSLERVSKWVIARPRQGGTALEQIGISDGKVVAYTYLGGGEEGGALEEACAAQRVLTAGELEHFHATGQLSLLPSLTLWAPHERLCNCHQVFVRDLDAALAGGVASFEDLRLTTGASTGCGACRPTLQRFCEHRFGHEVADAARSFVVRAPFWQLSMAASLYLVCCTAFAFWWSLRP